MAVRTVIRLFAAAAGAAGCNAADSAQAIAGLDANVADVDNVVAEAGVVGDSAVIGVDVHFEAGTEDAAPVRPCEAGGMLEAGVDLDAASALAPEPGPSCADLPDSCGPTASENCCTSLLVPGGSFCRSYDGVMYTDPSYPATVSTFWLDKYEVTGGRFENFIAAWNSGWRPAAGAGKHTHLNGGSGLANSAEAGFESGWEGAWEGNVAPAGRGSGTYPYYGINWYEGYAFCIWDGGYLPSEAEWNYAAAGGDEQRVYPWSTPPNSTIVGPDYVVGCAGPPFCNSPAPVGSKPPGNGKWGHADLSGSVLEWILDAYQRAYKVPCDDCSYLPFTESERVVRSDDYLFFASSDRFFLEPLTGTSRGPGVRCARNRS